MASAIPQPRLLDPNDSPVLEAREIMVRFPKRWVFVEVTEDYAPCEFDGFRGRVLAEAPTHKQLSPLVRSIYQHWENAKYVESGTIAFWTNCTPPKTFTPLWADVDE